MILKYKKTASFLVWLFLFFTVKSQPFYRIESNFSIMEKSTDGSENLIIGKVYFDKVKRQIVSDIKFPHEEVLIVTDTAIIKALGGSYEKQKLGKTLVDFSVFNLVLNGELDFFGLKSTPFELSDIERSEDMVISTWIFNEENATGNYQKMMLSQKDNRLYGLITFGKDEEIISKQIFSNYQEIQGLQVPTKIVHISYLPDGIQLKKITEYSNIKINNSLNDSYYYYNYSNIKF